MHIFHRWTEIWVYIKNNRLSGGRYLNGHYRFCGCGRWQKHILYADGNGEWEECDAPSLKGRIRDGRYGMEVVIK